MMYHLLYQIVSVLACYKTKKSLDFLRNEITCEITKIMNEEKFLNKNRDHTNIIVIKCATADKVDVLNGVMNFYRRIINRLYSTGTEYSTSARIEISHFLSFLQLKFECQSQVRADEKTQLNLADGYLTFNTTGSTTNQNSIFVLSDILRYESDYLFTFRICKELLKDRFEDDTSYIVISFNINDFDLGKENKKNSIYELCHYIAGLKTTVKPQFLHHDGQNCFVTKFGGFEQNHSLNLSVINSKETGDKATKVFATSLFACAISNKGSVYERVDKTENVILIYTVDFHVCTSVLNLYIVILEIGKSEKHTVYRLKVLAKKGDARILCLNLYIYGRKERCYGLSRDKLEYIFYDVSNQYQRFLDNLYVLIRTRFTNLISCGNLTMNLIDKNELCFYCSSPLSSEHIKLELTYCDMREKFCNLRHALKADADFYTYKRIKNVAHANSLQTYSYIKNITYISSTGVLGKLLTNTFVKIKMQDLEQTDKYNLFVESTIDYDAYCNKAFKMSIDDVIKRFEPQKTKYATIFKHAIKNVTLAELIRLFDINHHMCMETIILHICYGIFKDQYGDTFFKNIFTQVEGLDLTHMIKRHSNDYATISSNVAKVLLPKIYIDKKKTKLFVNLCSQYGDFVSDLHRRYHDNLLVDKTKFVWNVYVTNYASNTEIDCWPVLNYLQPQVKK